MSIHKNHDNKSEYTGLKVGSVDRSSPGSGHPLALATPTEPASKKGANVQCGQAYHGFNYDKNTPPASKAHTRGNHGSNYSGSAPNAAAGDQGPSAP